MTEKLLLTPEDAAERLQLSRTQIYALIKAGKVRSVKIGRARRISIGALEDFILESEREAAVES